MAFIITPALLDMTNPFAIDSAFAKQGGNGNGNGNSGGKGNGNSSSKSEKSNSTEKKATINNIAPKLGILNAARASAKAFATALPNSRVGKIKAYYVANQVALTAQTTADETDAAALHDTFLGSGPISVVNAYEALQTDSANPTLQDAYNQAATDAALTG